MEDVKFVLKSLVATIVVVFLLQIRVGSNTIEASTHDWIQNSAVTELMRGVADGGIKVSLDFYNWIRAKTGVGEQKMSSFWSSGSAEPSASRSSSRSHGSSHFKWGGGASRANSLPDDVGNNEPANSDSAD